MVERPGYSRRRLTCSRGREFETTLSFDNLKVRRCPSVFQVPKVVPFRSRADYGSPPQAPNERAEEGKESSGLELSAQWQSRIGDVAEDESGQEHRKLISMQRNRGNRSYNGIESSISSHAHVERYSFHSSGDAMTTGITRFVALEWTIGIADSPP